MITIKIDIDNINIDDSKYLIASVLHDVASEIAGQGLTNSHGLYDPKGKKIGTITKK